MANEKHLAFLRKGVNAWNQWRANHPEIEMPDISGADLRSANLCAANLSKANLSEAKLRESNLSQADLRAANLQGASLSKADLSKAKLCHANSCGTNFSGAKLSEADLSGVDFAGAKLARTDLSGASLSEAYLGGADLTRADLCAANLRAATMTRTKLLEIDLSMVKGLETIRHKAPSSIGIDTIYLSKGRIPHVFLRGAGVPDNFIEYMSSLTGKAFEYYSCFISYSTRDQDFAARLYADLQAKGVRCWFAPHHVQGGKKLYEQIDTAIRMHERLLLILSPDSIHSEWVKTEIAKARKREVRDKIRVLFPVRLGISFDQLRDWEYFDADIGKDSAREIREYYIPDFSQWKSHDSYQEEFTKLLRDLTKA